MNLSPGGRAQLLQEKLLGPFWRGGCYKEDPAQSPRTSGHLGIEALAPTGPMGRTTCCSFLWLRESGDSSRLRKGEAKENWPPSQWRPGSCPGPTSLDLGGHPSQRETLGYPLSTHYVPAPHQALGMQMVTNPLGPASGLSVWYTQLPLHLTKVS